MAGQEGASGGALSGQVDDHDHLVEISILLLVCHCEEPSISGLPEIDN